MRTYRVRGNLIILLVIHLYTFHHFRDLILGWRSDIPGPSTRVNYFIHDLFDMRHNVGINVFDIHIRLNQLFIFIVKFIFRFIMSTKCII